MARRADRLRVRFSETDAASIVFYPSYLQWFDQSTHDLLRELNFPELDYLDRGWGAFILEAHGRFLTPLAAGDLLTITSHVAEIRTRAFRVEHEIMRGDERVCEGYEVRVWAHMTPQGLEPHPLPEELRALLEE